MNDLRASLKISTMMMSLTFGIPDMMDNNRKISYDEYIECIMEQLEPESAPMVVATEDISYEEIFPKLLPSTDLAK